MILLIHDSDPTRHIFSSHNSMMQRSPKSSPPNRLSLDEKEKQRKSVLQTGLKNFVRKDSLSYEEMALERQANAEERKKQLENRRALIKRFSRPRSQPKPNTHPATLHTNINRTKLSKPPKAPPPKRQPPSISQHPILQTSDFHSLQTELFHDQSDLIHDFEEEYRKLEDQIKRDRENIDKRLAEDLSSLNTPRTLEPAPLTPIPAPMIPPAQTPEEHPAPLGHIQPSTKTKPDYLENNQTDDTVDSTIEAIQLLKDLSYFNKQRERECAEMRKRMTELESTVRSMKHRLARRRADLAAEVALMEQIETTGMTQPTSNSEVESESFTSASSSSENERVESDQR